MEAEIADGRVRQLSASFVFALLLVVNVWPTTYAAEVTSDARAMLLPI